MIYECKWKGTEGRERERGRKRESEQEGGMWEEGMTSCFQLGLFFFKIKGWNPHCVCEREIVLIRGRGWRLCPPPFPKSSQDHWAVCGCVCVTVHVGVKDNQREQKKVICECVHIFPNVLVGQWRECMWWVCVCVVRRGEYEKKKLNKSVNMSKRQ